MGKKVKKTRWRTLTLNGHQSDDSEESLLTAGDNYQRKYSKFSYSTHSSPIRKFEHDSSKTTRSNSTTSEKKATFNEDEYTRITTPRQDVLFKKGYLNKPKLYQTQTSTGTNSTSTCTPDHQSADGMEGTDVEYESQFVFPNGFIDQNGIYYINSFEPFPFVVYNAPICYAEYPNSRTKRYSTDSMAESVSPQNGESGATNVSTQPSDEEQPVRLKKRRRRKISPSKSVTSEASSDDVFKTEECDAQDVFKVENKSELKADAEEFIPRNLQAFDPNVHFFNMPPNFIPVPFDPPPPFVPVNFISPAQKFVNVIPEVQEAKPDTEAKKKTDIDIAKIVWKLEEAAKEQDNKKSYKPKTRPRFGHYQNRDWKPKTAEAAAPARVLGNARPVEKKTEIKVVPSPVRTPRKSNQWIPVASRKKRKNKGAEEEAPVEEVVDETSPLSDDLFESFDITQLVDVVPPSKLETVLPKPETGLPQPEVVTECVKSEPDIHTPQETRKKKKKTIKIATKKVIVTDFPPVEKMEVAEEPPCEPVCEVAPREPVSEVAPHEPVSEVAPCEAVSEVAPPVIEETILTEAEEKIIVEEKTIKSASETPEKKKKKKKKPAKSTSNPTPNSDCDTYDFLLETSDDFDKKTNVEISQELDRMIQKGMYSSLEGKIRSMNIDLDDAFFRIVTKSESPRPSTSGGIFRWNLEEFQDKGEDNQNTPTITLTNVTSVPSEPILSRSPPPPPPPHYPITQAVREWMTRTRENTPDAEIFKSPKELEDDRSACEAETEPKNTIEDCEEAIEVYESRYGNNEDFLRIRSEIAEAQKNTRRSDLPYRAICCNLM